MANIPNIPRMFPLGEKVRIKPELVQHLYAQEVNDLINFVRPQAHEIAKEIGVDRGRMESMINTEITKGLNIKYQNFKKN